MNKKLTRRLAALLLSLSVVISSTGVFANTNVLADGNVTREEFAQMCERSLTELGYNFEQSQTSPFKDTKDASVIKLHNAGLLAGTALDQFSPKAGITVEQMAAIIVRMYEKLEVELPMVRDSKTLDQESISPWALDAVKLAYEAGLIGRDGVALSPKSQIRQEQMDLVVAQSELVIADIKSKQVQDNENYTYSPVSKTITIKKDLNLNELEMPKDLKKMIINAGVKITLTDLKIEEVAVNEGASVTLENMQVNKLELLGNGTLVTSVYLDKGSKVKNVILEAKTKLYAGADSQIEDIAIKTEAKDSVLEIKNIKGMNIKADNDFKLNGKNVDKNNKTTTTGNNTSGGSSSGGDNNTDEGNNGGNPGDDNSTDEENSGGTPGDDNTDEENNGSNPGDDNNTDDENNGSNPGDDNNTDEENSGGTPGDDNNIDDDNNGSTPGDDNNTGSGDDTENTTPDEEGTVQTVYDKLTDKFILGEKNASIDNVQHAINLPWDLDGCRIYWEISRPDIINYNGTLPGILVGDVELTATISQGDESIEKKFTLTVKKFIDLEDMRQVLDNWEFIEEISGDYQLPKKVGKYDVIYTTYSTTCVGNLDVKTYTLKPTSNGTAELRVMISDSGETEIARIIKIKVNLSGTTPRDTTTDTAIFLGL